MGVRIFNHSYPLSYASNRVTTPDGGERQNRLNMTENKKSEISNLRIPASAVIGESKKAVLVSTTKYMLWISKDFITKNKLADFMQAYNIGIVLDWTYKVTSISSKEIKETSGPKLFESLKNFFEIYNFEKVSKSDNIDEIESI